MAAFSESPSAARSAATEIVQTDLSKMEPLQNMHTLLICIGFVGCSGFLVQFIGMVPYIFYIHYLFQFYLEARNFDCVLF